MNHKLKLLTDWLRANKLSLNESKTKLLIFRPRRKLNITVLNIKLNNFSLTPEKTVLYLGIEIEEAHGTNKQKFLLKNLVGQTAYTKRSITVFTVDVCMYKKGLLNVAEPSLLWSTW